MNDVEIYFTVCLENNLTVDIKYNNSDYIHKEFNTGDIYPSGLATWIKIPYYNFDKDIFLKSIEENNYSSFCNFKISEENNIYSLSFFSFNY